MKPGKISPLLCFIALAAVGLWRLATWGGGSQLDEKEALETLGIGVALEKIKKDLVFVEGGTFWMGDYGVAHGPEGLPVDPNENSKPVHEVYVSSYSISRYKVTNSDYQIYLARTGQRTAGLEEYDELRLFTENPDLPASLDWYEASKYCEWLAIISHLPFSMPTEAQWEYAARSRGRFVPVATDDGTFKATNEHQDSEGDGGPRGLNMATDRDRKEFAKAMGWNTGRETVMPVDAFPPNPLGIHAMTDNGFEWVADWYDPDYYQSSPVHNPTGPQEPIVNKRRAEGKPVKVLRGVDFASSYPFASTVSRTYDTPDATFVSPLTGNHLRVVSDKTARCVVNTPQPIN